MNVHSVMGIFRSFDASFRRWWDYCGLRYDSLIVLPICIYVYTLWCFVLFNVRQPQYGRFKRTRIACVKWKFKDVFTFAREKNAKQKKRKKERLRRAIVGRERWANTLNSFIKCIVCDAIRHDVRYNATLALLFRADDMIYWIATVSRARLLNE